MAENKTKTTNASVDAYINRLPEDRRADAMAIAKLMEVVSRQKPKMWGPSIVGFGSYHYRHDSRREGDMPLVCFSPRKNATVIYNMSSADKALLDKLGKHVLSGSCLHTKKMSDVDPKILKTFISASLAKMRAQSSK